MNSINEQVDPKLLDDAIRNWNETSMQLAKAKAELKELAAEVAGQESYIVQVVEQLKQEQRRVDDIMVRVKQKSEGGRASYKKSFEFLLNKVNKQLQEAANELLESTRGDKWIKKVLVREGAGSLGAHELEEKIKELPSDERRDMTIMLRAIISGRNINAGLEEGIVKRVTDAIRTAVDSFRRKLQGTSKDIDLLDKMEKETTESINRKGLTDALIESAVK